MRGLGKIRDGLCDGGEHVQDGDGVLLGVVLDKPRVVLLRRRRCSAVRADGVSRRNLIKMARVLAQT